MNKRIVVPPATLAGVLLIAALIFLVFAPLPQSSVAQTTKAPPVALAPPAVNATSAVKFAAGSYVHLANCQSALTGGNGDNDIAAYLSSGGYGGWGWLAADGYTRQSNTHLVVYFDVYKNGSFDGSRAAYCMGDDSNIVDKAGSAPSGW